MTTTTHRPLWLFGIAALVVAGIFLWAYQTSPARKVHCQRVVTVAPIANPASPVGISAIPVVRTVCN